MFIDARSVDSGRVVEADICIVGAGPAGITLAKELINSSLQICLLESGGIDSNSDLQALNDSMEALGDQVPPLQTFPLAQTMRTRQFGGTSHQWDGAIRYVPLEEIDFEKRDWIPHSGWPIKKADLDPYYARSQEVCGLGVYSYEPKDWQTDQEPPIKFDDRFLINRMFQFGPTDIFLNHHREVLKASSNVDAYLHASVYELETDETGQRVKRAKVKTPRGDFWVQAKQFILATGGIENARILLLSKQMQKQGLGNQHDLVGRFLMDHPLVRVGVLHPPSRKVINRMRLYGMQRLETLKDFEYQCKPIVSPAAMRREQLLSANAFLLPRHPWTRFNLLRQVLPNGKSYVSPAISAAISLSRSLRKGAVNGETLQQLKTVLSGLDDIIYFQARKHLPLDLESRWPQDPSREKRLGTIQVYSATEQAPCYDNRVTLGAERDAFGYPKVQLIWRWDELSRRSFVKVEKLFQTEFARAGLGQLQIELDKGDPQGVRLSTHHNMGTTRMHDDPKQGVVDANCQVHGVDNLFVAGSSVFTTGSYANPTLTIIALSIRLADHLKTLMKD